MLISSFLKKIYQRFVRIRGNPREIALGFALGLFIGLSPTMGAQILISVFFASLLKWNKITAAIGVQITNPLTAPAIYGFTYFIGAKIIGLQTSLKLPFAFDWYNVVNMIEQAPRILLALTVGGIIIGTPVAIFGYFSCLAFFNRYQNSLRERMLRQKEKLKQKMPHRKTRNRTGKRLE